MRSLFAGGRDELPDEKGKHRKRHADLHQRDRHALDRYAGNPHDRVLGMGHHLGQRKQGADQGRDRQDFVGPAGKAQEHIERGEGQPITAAADIAELLDEIEEREQE